MVTKEENVNFKVIYRKDKVIDFQYIIEYDNIAYLMYFAIEKSQRNIGYGSEILKERWNKYQRNFSYAEGIEFEDIMNCLEIMIEQFEPVEV